jgi:ceramide glucosyltransferase
VTVFIVTGLALAALAYQLLSIAASLRQLMRSARPSSFHPPLSILKPVCGLDIGFEEAIEGHAAQDYPEFEILFGVRDMDDAAVPAIRRLIQRHPQRQIRLIHCPLDAPNAKVGVLMGLEECARYPLMLINDSDISVPQGYLRTVVAPLRDPGVALVTCIYRALAASTAGQWEALGIAVDFIPSTLVAPMVGVREFGLGSTLCFRASDLKQIGGFAAVADYIADDYQLARRLTGLGKRAYMSEISVDTHLSAPGWAEVWDHQVRWARTIRVSRGDGFIGLPITHAGLWCVLCFVTGLPSYAIALWIMRSLMALVTGGFVLRSRQAMLMCGLAPVWDLWAFAVWVAAWSGKQIRWRGGIADLTPDGRMVAADVEKTVVPN